MRTQFITGLLLLSIVLVPSLRADNEPVAVADDASSAPSSETIDQLIKQLDSDRFAERREANQKLQAAGDAAIKPLAEAAIGDSREVTNSALEILRKHFEKGAATSKEAAKAALEKIAASNHSAAGRAKDILKPPAQARAVPFRGGILPIAPGQIQIRIAANGNGRRMKKIQVNNGVKTIEAEDDGKKVKIVDDPNKGIEIEITEKKDGKEKTEKFAAKDAAELKKKHPDAYKVYEKHSKNVGGIQIRGGGIQIRGIQVQPGRAVPAAVPKAGAARNDAMRRIAKTQLQSAQRQIQAAKRVLEKVQPSENEKQEDLKKTIERIGDIEKQLQEEQTKLGD